MIEVKKVFLDTAPLIYFLDSDVNYGEKTRLILEDILSSGKILVLSVITRMEYLIYPFRTNNTEKINVFFEFVRDCNIPVQGINMEIAELAARIRAEYKDFKSMDALQLATAEFTRCDTFLTNDKQLRQFKQLNCMTVEDWQA